MGAGKAMKNHLLSIKMNLDTGEVLEEKLVPCQPYEDPLPLFAKVLAPEILPERDKKDAEKAV